MCRESDLAKYGPLQLGHLSIEMNAEATVRIDAAAIVVPASGFIMYDPRSVRFEIISHPIPMQLYAARNRMSQRLYRIILAEFILLANDERMHHYQRRRTWITGLEL